ncbi:MAG: ABC transporter ATP-binding protein [Treponema sp.]|nr:ABC transporter ATP-binding protein [Treponema sp.]
MALLECKNLCIGYPEKKVAENLNFSIEKGDFFFIIGENGSGKSTLMKTLLGFIKALSGKIEYSSDWNKKELGYLPQTSEIQKSFPATVWEILISGFQGKTGWLPFYSKEYKEKALEILETVGMSQYLKKSFKELSGGQQQRVLFARALCAATSILVMDEPAKGFDSEITAKMHSILEDLNKKGLTIITISHDHAAAEKYGTKILKLGSENGTVRELSK